MRVKCLAQEHNTMARPGLEPGPLEPESGALATRPPLLKKSSTVISVGLYINFVFILNKLVWL